MIKEMMMGVSAYRPTVKFWLLQTALALLILMLARPQMGSKISHEKRNGIETIIALDISNSMLCQDVAPTRLDKSKLLVENLVDKFTNDKIGLIVFAGDARYRYCSRYQSFNQQFHTAGKCGKSYYHYY